MKVTDEILSVAEKAYDDYVENKDDVCCPYAMRKALDAALADVPAPLTLTTEQRDAIERYRSSKREYPAHGFEYTIIALLDAAYPPPKPAETVEEVLAEMRSKKGWALIVQQWADRIESALKAK